MDSGRSAFSALSGPARLAGRARCAAGPREALRGRGGSLTALRTVIGPPWGARPSGAPWPRLFLALVLAFGVIVAQPTGVAVAEPTGAVAERVDPIRAGQGAASLMALARDPVVDAARGQAPNVHPSPSGAMGVNRDYEAGRRDEPFVEEQRAAADWIQLGFVRGRPEWRDVGWRAISYGFDLQRPDGSFEGRRDRVHGASMFLEAAARAAVLERDMGRRDIALAFVDDVARTARWLASRDPLTDPELVQNRRFTHRLWIVAAALAEAAELEGDSGTNLREVAAGYARRALEAQWADGVFPEREGYDVGYHAAAIVYAARYTAFCRDAGLRAASTAAIARAAEWLATRVRADGDVNPEGSTRIFLEHDRAGRLKATPYGLVAEAFGAAASVVGRADLRNTGRSVLRSPGFAAYYRPPAPQESIAKDH